MITYYDFRTGPRVVTMLELVDIGERLIDEAASLPRATELSRRVTNMAINLEYLTTANALPA
jgi:hypothetical protein